MTRRGAGSYDLVTAFLCLHDMARPVEVLRAMRGLAGADGAVLVADPTGIEREIAEKYARQREEVRAEEETRRYERIHQRDQTRPTLDAGAEEQIKRRYRDLVKRFHPDLARTDEERRLRTAIMQRVNAAFHSSVPVFAPSARARPRRAFRRGIETGGTSGRGRRSDEGWRSSSQHLRFRDGFPLR